MRKTVITLAASLLGLWAQADPVGLPTATQAARSFVHHTLQLKGDLQPVPRQWAYSGMYLFALGEGFVITSADDAARPVLAYSLDGAFDPSNLAPNLKGILDTYEAEIALARRDHLPADPAWQTILENRSLLAGTKDVPAAVGPLVETQWGQYAPYNALCPSGVPSGCVATAATQVMRYWNYPAFGQGSHAYNCATFGNLGADFAHTRYDWANMPATASSTSPAEVRTALATLTFHVGVSVNMDYNYTQSGASTGGGDNSAIEALKNYFHYNRSDINYRSKGQTSDSLWTEFLMAELRQRRPIMYDGTAGAFGGHSFICDGYDSLRLLHFNLGEFGEGDGYYAVGSITYLQYNLNGNNSAITGIHPEYGLYSSDTMLTYHRSGGAQQVWIATSDTADAPWSATASDEWITLSDTDFDHLGAMTVTLADNTTGHERSGSVTIRQGNLSTRFSVKQAAFDEEDYCPLTVHMESSRNQAWSNGAHVSFESPDGLVYATATHSANGASSSATVNVAPRDVVVRWHAGGPLDRYYNYAVVNAHGDTLVNVNNAYYNGTDTLLERPCASVGIGTASALRTLLYPNPSQGTVSVTAAEAIRSVRVMNSLGQCILLLHPDGTTSCTLPLESCNPGVYMVQLTTDSGTSTHRLTLAR